MANATEGEQPPRRARLLIATAIVILTVLAVWKVIDYRSQPPPPPHPVAVPAGK